MMGAIDKPIGESPIFNINCVETWEHIIELADANPITSVNVIMQDRNQDLEYSSKNFITLFMLQDRIDLLRAQNKEVQRRNSIGLWTKLITAERQSNAIFAWNDEVQRCNFIGLWTDLMTATFSRNT